MREFNHIAKIIKKARLDLDMTQLELSNLIGYENGQYISNVERGLCSIPLKRLQLTAETLVIPPRAIGNAMIDDYIELVKKTVN